MKKLLEKVVEMALCKNRKLKSWLVIEGGSIIVNCKNGFGNKQGGEIEKLKFTKEEKRIIDGDCVKGCIYKYTYHFLENLQTLFWNSSCYWPFSPTLKEKRLLKTQFFDGYVLHPHKVLWFLYSMIIDLIDLSWHLLLHI